MSNETDSSARPASQRQPTCRYLRSKGMYITGSVDLGIGEGGAGEVGDGHCWCNQTQNVLGPDDQFVGREACAPGRSCFVATLSL